MLSIGIEGKVLNGSNSDPKKRLATLRVDRRMTCAYRVSVHVHTKWAMEILVGSLCFQLVVLALFLRHPPGSMISSSH